METPKLTGLKKRQQIQAANKTMFIWIIAASVAVAICLVLAQFMVRQFFFNSKIISEKAKTQQVLDRNIEVVEDLKSSVNKLTANEGLAKLKAAETDTALQVIIDALPTSDDRAGLATSLQQIVLARSGVSIDSLSVTDGQIVALPQAATPTAPSSTSATATAAPLEIVFNFVITGDYTKISQALTDVERTIRPISIETIDITGTGSQLKATVGAKTYYVPPKTVQLQTKTVKP